MINIFNVGEDVEMEPLYAASETVNKHKWKHYGHNSKK